MCVCVFVEEGGLVLEDLERTLSLSFSPVLNIALMSSQQTPAHDPNPACHAKSNSHYFSINP